MHGTISLQNRKLSYLVIWGLGQADAALKLMPFRLVTWGLAAPRAAICPHLAAFHPYDRAVIVQQKRAFDMFPPQPCMRALSCAALTKEQDCLIIMHDAAAMNGDGIIWKSHQSVTDP